MSGGGDEPADQYLIYNDESVQKEMRLYNGPSGSDHDLWSFLDKVGGLSLRDKVRSAVTWGELGVESLLLRVEKSVEVVQDASGTLCSGDFLDTSH